jgi:hypothetical protein
MRTWHLVLACVAGVALAAPLDAQTVSPAPLTRFDFQASVGWVHVQRPDLASYDDWDHGVADAATALGWYWTDHFKTEVELQVSSAAEFYHFEQFVASGAAAYRTSRFTLRSTGVGLSATYQFLRNAWVHPFVGGGVVLRRESLEEEVQPVVVYDAATRQVREISPAQRIGPTSSFADQPFVVTGLKAYVSQRAFFRTDLRVGFSDRIDEVVARVGFGLDF